MRSSAEIVEALDIFGIQYTISVPFARLAELKRTVERRTWWRRASGETAFFELKWKPKKWDKAARFVVIRTREPKQRKGPLQPGLFEPYQYGYEFKVILTHSPLSAILAHNLNRELHMSAYKAERATTEKRAPLWDFVRLATRRMRIFQRAGRLTNPKGRLTLTMSANPAVQTELLHLLKHAA